MKYVLFAFVLSLFLPARAFAGCTGGMDGTDTYNSCTEIGALGDLVFERDASGMVLRKRTDQEIKMELATKVDTLLRRRGITVKDVNNNNSLNHVEIDENSISFDLFNINGDKIYRYSIDKAKGIPENERDLIARREAYDAEKDLQKKKRLSRIEKLEKQAQELNAQIEAEKKSAKK